MKEASTELHRVLLTVVKGLVDDEDSVHIDIVFDEPKVTAIIFCASEDRKRVIGKQGRTINSLRTIMHSVAAKHRYKADLFIDED